MPYKNRRRGLLRTTRRTKMLETLRGLVSWLHLWAGTLCLEVQVTYNRVIVLLTTHKPAIIWLTLLMGPYKWVTTTVLEPVVSTSDLQMKSTDSGKQALLEARRRCTSSGGGPWRNGDRSRVFEGCADNPQAPCKISQHSQLETSMKSTTGIGVIGLHGVGRLHGVSNAQLFLAGGSQRNV